LPEEHTVLNTVRQSALRFATARGDGAALAAPDTHAEVEAALSGEAAAELYRWAPLALTACALLAVLMTVAIDLVTPGSASWTWLTLCLLSLGARLIHASHWRRAVKPAASDVLIRQFALGAVVTAGLWAVLPWLVFSVLDASGRFIVLATLVSMVLAATRLLGSMRRLALLHAAILLLPAAAWLLGSGDNGERMMGLTVVGLFVVVAIAILSLHRALRAAHDNRRLIRIEAKHRDLLSTELDGRRKAERLLAELTEAHAMMERAKQGLERGIEDRTSALEDRSRELARQAVTDSLTGLPNRKGINQHLSELLAEVVGPDPTTHLALLFLDLDHFKEVNDLMGHLAGDAVLCAVAERLRETIPRGAFAARWGGDEFVVVLPGLRRAAQVTVVAEQLRAALSEPVRLQERVARIGCSIGIAMSPEHGTTPEALVIAADQAVYSAKAEGSGRVRMFDQALAEQTGRQHLIAQALPAAVELGQLQVVYQPIVSAAGGDATHVEALARWRHPQWGVVAPSEFIPVAEASGLIHIMGRWVLRQACRDAARWPGAQPPKVSVNVSAMQVTSGRLVAQVREALATSGLPPQRLVIELTESLPMGGREQVDSTLKDLRAMGVKLAIDDFGTGYSSLSSLMRQPLSLVKIDRSFVRDVPGEGELLIKATVDVARCFGLEVVAEGVETQAQQARLIALGVDYLQGYLFGRPMATTEFAAWLALRDGSQNVIALRA
jgi:diguanylate cyclase (GGDEF)-like protein